MDHQNGTLQSISIDLIDLDISNHRAVENDQALQDLAESIKVHGLLEPVSVYRKDDGRFTLGFGHRRLAAHQFLERTTIPAIVHEAAPEAQIRAAQAVENLHRKDLTPLEEAQACQQLVTSLKADDQEPTDDLLDQAAAMVGRTRTWFTNRLGLMRLSESCQISLRDGHIYLGHALQLAKLPDHEAQDEVLEAIEAFDEDSMPQSVPHCRNMVEARLQDLSKVNWKLDAEFAGKPACSACPHNSANQPGLFDGDQPKKPMCLEAACFNEKSRATSLGIIRASNTLAKMDKQTSAAAEKAAEEREAAFLKPAAVVARAKQGSATSDTKKRSADHRDAADETRRTKESIAIDRAFNEADDEWRIGCEELVAAELRRSANRIGAYTLIRKHPAWEDANSEWRSKAAQQKAQNLLRPKIALFKNATNNLLAELALCIEIPKKQLLWPLDEEGYYGENEHSLEVLQMFADAMGISFPKQPVREDFVKKAEPKAAKAKKKAA